jgi:SNF2 family DNA or RNA helicase
MATDGGGYLGWDRGLGKTLGAIVLSRELGAERVIVVGPNSSKELVWRPELDTWTAGVNVYNFGGTAKRRTSELDEWRERGGWLLVHYEGLRLHDWSREQVDLLIVDEAHRLQNGHAGNRAPLFYKSLRKMKPTYRLMLSGSIIVNGIEDMFGALHLMYPDRDRRRWADWNDRYIEYVEGSAGRIAIGVQNTEELRHELGTFLVQRLKEDELPTFPLGSIKLSGWICLPSSLGFIMTWPRDSFRNCLTIQWFSHRTWSLSSSSFARWQQGWTCWVRPLRIRLSWKHVSI